MTFCPSYGLAMKVVNSYQKSHPHFSINQNCIKRYWSDCWLFTQYGFRVPSLKEDLFSIKLNPNPHLVNDWFIKVEYATFFLFEEEVLNNEKTINYDDYYKIECNDSILCLSKRDMHLVTENVKQFKQTNKGKT